MGNSTGEDSKEEDSKDSDSDAATPSPPAANQFEELEAEDLENDFEIDYGDEYYYEDGIYDDYYDELDDEDYYDEEDDIPVDDIPNPIGLNRDVEINVNISDKKNDILEVPKLEQKHIHKDTVPQKVDNDMESSDLGFSDHEHYVDEHSYQIEQLGDFDYERTEDEVIASVDEDHSVDFSTGELEVE